MMNNGRPLTKKQAVRLMVGLTILAWATQTLLKQWGFGQDISSTSDAQQVEPDVPREKFVPGSPRYLQGATLEMRSEATVIGGEVKLKQVCRWADQDRAIFDPVGDLVLIHLSAGTPFKAISIEELRGILRDAGINVAPINFAGPMSCTVSRSDVQYDEKDALQQWITAKQGPSADATSDHSNNQTQNDPATSTTSTTATTAPSAVAEAPSTSPSDASPIKSLRQSLLEDVAMRLSLPTDSLQVNFKAQDERVLNISSPLFRYQIDPISVRTLGNVSWNVSIISNDGSSKKVAINAEARAWQNQLLINKPLAAGQVIRVSDLTPRRALVNELSDDPLVTSEQVVGQQAGRELKSGTVLTARMIDPVQLVKTGQFVTITLDQGTVKIRTVARALEGGSFGQTIRVKNESTNDIYQVVVTGPQAATMNLATPLATAAGPPE